MMPHRTPQTLRPYQQTPDGLNALYDPSIGSKTARTQGVSA